MKFLSLLLVICITAASSVLHVGATNNSDANVYSIKMDLQEEAVIAYQNMMKVFDPDGVFNFNYPEEYAGAYVSEDSHLVLCLTDVNGDNISKYQELCQNSSVLRFQQSEYSYVELKDLAKIIYESGNDQDIVDISILAKDNSIVVGVESNDIATKAIGIITNVQSEQQKDAKFFKKNLSTLPIKIEYREKAKQTAGLIGGDKIRNARSGSNFTLGVCGTYNGSPAFFSCGHGNIVGDSITTSSRTPIGQVVVQQNDNGEYYDYSIVKITNTAAFSTTNKVYGSGGGAVNITGVYTYPVEGTTVYKYGAVSGYAYGGVYSSETSVAYTPSLVIWGLTTVKLTSGTSAAGDSGGPYYFNNKISGVHSGAGGTTVYYSPILTGSFTVKTTP